MEGEELSEAPKDIVKIPSSDLKKGFEIMKRKAQERSMDRTPIKKPRTNS